MKVTRAENQKPPRLMQALVTRGMVNTQRTVSGAQEWTAASRDSKPVPACGRKDIGPKGKCVKNVISTASAHTTTGTRDAQPAALRLSYTSQSPLPAL